MDIEITEARYTDDGVIIAIVDGKTYSIPDDPANRHRQMLAEWEAEGNTIAAYVPLADPDPLTIPLNRFQFDAMLRILGVTDSAIETAIDTLVTDATENAIAKARFYRAETYNRGHPLFDLLAPELGLTAGDIDTAWTTAVTIR